MDTLGDALLVRGIPKPSFAQPMPFSLTCFIRSKLVIVEIKDITNCEQQYYRGILKVLTHIMVICLI